MGRVLALVNQIDDRNAALANRHDCHLSHCRCQSTDPQQGRFQIAYQNTTVLDARFTTAAMD